MTGRFKFVDNMSLVKESFSNSYLWITIWNQMIFIEQTYVYARRMTPLLSSLEL